MGGVSGRALGTRSLYILKELVIFVRPPSHAISTHKLHTDNRRWFWEYKTMKVTSEYLPHILGLNKYKTFNEVRTLFASK